MPITTANVLRGQTTQVLDEANEEIDTRKKKNSVRGNSWCWRSSQTWESVEVFFQREREGGGETDTVTERQREKEVGREQHNDRVSKHEFTASNLVVFRGYF